MQLALVMIVLFCTPSATQAQTTPQGLSPNPAIVRIIAPENNGVSFGSGSLVAVNDTYGLVITNWHVVRDATGIIYVAFPNGFYTAATLLKIDRDWDLAALAVWKPNIQPLPIADQAPQLGEYLTIAGYGSGTFRATTGQCTQYVSPGSNLPFEMVELSTAARNGDSGGPILNNRGEIAGVLFGSSFGHTTGSYCGRLRWFLSSVADDFQRLPAPNTAIAQQQPEQKQQPSPMVPVAAIKTESPEASQPDVASNAHSQPNAIRNVSHTAERKPVNYSTTAAICANKSSLPQSPPAAEVTPVEASALDQLRNFMAVVGIFAVLFQGLRVVGKVTK